MQPNQLCNSRYTFNRKRRATTEHILDRRFRRNAGDNEKVMSDGSCDQTQHSNLYQDDA